MVELKEYGKNYNGKHNGWTYQFLDDNYKGIHLGVCCKDYLQDILWSELTQKEMKVYGQTSTYLGILDKQEKLILCLTPYTYDIKEEVILELSLNLECFLNEIELLKNFEFSCVNTDEKNIVITFSKQWIEKPMLFSLFTLFCRFGLYYDGNLEEYISKPDGHQNRPFLDTCDFYSIKTNATKILALINNELTMNQKDWTDLTGGNPVHDSGFFSNISKLTKNETITT